MNKEILVVVLLFIFSFISPAMAAHPWDAGDTIALLLGLAIGIVAICAGLGAWARKRGEV
jgi:hypothetical protein